MKSLPLSPGNSVSFSKTVSESDVMLFAGITGDFSPNHVDEEFMKNSAFGRRIAHGALLVGYMSRTSSMIIERSVPSSINETPVSVGYDRIRFLKPVYLGDTITVNYTVEEIIPEKKRAVSQIEVHNQKGELVAVARHILQWVPSR